MRALFCVINQLSYCKYYIYIGMVNKPLSESQHLRSVLLSIMANHLFSQGEELWMGAALGGESCKMAYP
ncbi:hypothetical protein LPB140_05760 [Sphingorhabdus lutea]|uniref:Uncharacterized protein n=1 Tax=Sphingorhabdus lutea TaxID=1913578 RepID=A0A1L3JB76_9SPHN|nr:hypothetical protein LPB140_05760 [Sphingorhabdus lutea]